MNNVKIDFSDNSTLLSCKSCSKEISISANNCQNCGDCDPLGFKTIQELGEKKKAKESIYGIGLVSSLLIGYSTVWWAGLLVFIVFVSIAKYIIDEYFSEYRTYYYNLRNEVKEKNNVHNFDVWNKYAQQIIKKYY